MSGGLRHFYWDAVCQTLEERRRLRLLAFWNVRQRMGKSVQVRLVFQQRVALPEPPKGTNPARQVFASMPGSLARFQKLPAPETDLQRMPAHGGYVNPEL